MLAKGSPWSRDGGMPEGCPSRMVFVVSLHVLWCRFSLRRGPLGSKLKFVQCVGTSLCATVKAARFASRCMRGVS